MFTSPGLKKRHYAPFIALLAFGVLSVALGVNLSLKDVYSATGSMYIQTPTTAIEGETVNIAIRINPGGAHIDTVTATIGFDAAKFAYSKIDFTGTPFTTQLPTKTTDNSVTVVSSLLGGDTIDQDSLIAIVSFTPRAYETKFQADFSLTGNAAYAGTATDPAYTNHTFSFTQPSATNIPTNPLESFFSPTDQSSSANETTHDTPPTHNDPSPTTITPKDDAAAHNEVQILLKTSDMITQARRVTPASLIMIGAGFVLMCITVALFVHYKKRHDEFLSLQSHMNVIRV